MKLSHQKKIKYLIVLLTIILITSLIIVIKKRNGHNPGYKIKKIKPLYKKVIVVDPGHGGIDGGTKHQNILEKDINLEIGLKLKEQLVSKGATVLMTREKDESLEELVSEGSRHSRDLRARVAIINESKAHIFISIHVNHIKNTKPMGAIVFFMDDNTESLTLAKEVQKNLNTLSEYERNNFEMKRVPLSGDYYILNNSKIPGILVETGFISNELDRRLLRDENHQNELAHLIISGIFDFFDISNADE